VSSGHTLNRQVLGFTWGTSLKILVPASSSPHLLTQTRICIYILNLEVTFLLKVLQAILSEQGSLENPALQAILVLMAGKPWK
jgi:hypothetical protein